MRVDKILTKNDHKVLNLNKKVHDLRDQNDWLRKQNSMLQKKVELLEYCCLSMSSTVTTALDDFHKNWDRAQEENEDV